MIWDHFSRAETRLEKDLILVDLPYSFALQRPIPTCDVWFAIEDFGAEGWNEGVPRHGLVGHPPMNKTGDQILARMERTLSERTIPSPSGSTLVALHGGSLKQLIELVRGDEEVDLKTAELFVHRHLE